MIALKIKIEKKSGEIWHHNKKRGQCNDCNFLKPIFYSYILSSGKILTQTCEECFDKYDYFSIEKP